MISVCIPAYKHADLTFEAARSVLRQDVDVELVVLDDFYLLDKTASNKDSIERLRTYLASDKRVRSSSNIEHLPIQDNWNKVVSLCSGKFVKLIGADDKLLPGSLDRIGRIIAKHDDIALHGHLANVIDANGHLLRKQACYRQAHVARRLSSVEALRGKLRLQVRFKEPACNFFLKSAWRAVGGYDSKFRFAFDIHFNVKLMALGSSMLWNEYLVELRRHQASDGAQLPAAMALSDLEGVLQEILRFMGSSVDTADRNAAHGTLQYRLIELAAHRLKRSPQEVLKLLVSNVGVFLKDPRSFRHCLRLLYSRLLHGDVQQ